MITHVLFDADGVLQHLPGGWYQAMRPHLGDRAREFMHYTWNEELPMLAGQGDYLAHLAKNLREFGVQTPVEVIFDDVWRTIEVHQHVLDVVAAVRAAGYGVHLGTNQEQHRANYMREALGYQALFDTNNYSCELGAAKPSLEFFGRAAQRIGAPAEHILFIDDMPANVAGAHDAGLRAFVWTHDEGLDSLRDQLTKHGVTW